MRTTIDRAGRVVIPKPIRDRLGLRGGEELELREEDGRIEIGRAIGDEELVEVGGLLTFKDSRGPATLEETLESIDEVREPRS